MNQIQKDFIAAVTKKYPFLATYDDLTDALAYALEISEENEDGHWQSEIGGKKFVAKPSASFWGGDLLTGG